MKSLQIDEKEAKRLYPTASNEMKIIFENTFGKEFFKKKLIEQILNFDDILRIANKDLEDIIPWKGKKLTKQQKSQNALAKIQLISEVLNEGVEIDFLDRDQSKYYPYFERKASSWVVSSYYCYSYGAGVGFGCYYKSSELALFAGNTFLDIYIDYLP